jgi:hypothetical protein
MRAAYSTNKKEGMGEKKILVGRKFWKAASGNYSPPFVNTSRLLKIS